MSIIEFVELSADTLYIKPVKLLPEGLSSDSVYDIEVGTLGEWLQRINVKAPLDSFIGNYMEIGFSAKVTIKVAGIPVNTNTKGVKYVHIV